MRPDEKATQSIIERQKQSDKNLKSGVKTAVNVGLTAAGLAGVSKIAPFLSEFIPEDLAFKGIKKVSPKLGSILDAGMASGLTVKSGLDFLKENISKKPKAENQASSNKNILDQYSPELKQFIEDKINAGRSPLQAAVVAEENDQFKDIVKKIKEDHKLNKNFGFFDLIKSIYSTGLAEDEPQSKADLQPPQDPQQGGQGQQALMAILQKIQQQRGS